MARILHINCPRCGGTLGMVGTERITKCRFCGTWSLVDAKDVVPEYYVKPLLGEVTARRTVQTLLRDKDMPDGLLSETRFHSAKLYFVPYHEMSGKRLGTMTTSQWKEERTRYSSSFQGLGNPYGSSVVSLREERAMTPRKKEVDTRVVMSDIGRIEPAVRLSEWGLEESDLETLRTEPAGRLRPMDRKLMERQGKVFDPTESSKDYFSMFDTKGFSAYNEDNTEIRETRVKRIYYPVWRIRYRYKGRLFGVTLDGVTGKVMHGRAPQDDKYRVLWMLGTSAIVSLIAGKIGRLLYIAIMDLGGRMDASTADGIGRIAAIGLTYGLPITLVMLAFALFIMGIGWEQFRYQGELVIQGSKRMVEKIGRPPKTWFEKANSYVLKALSEIFSNSRRTGWLD